MLLPDLEVDYTLTPESAESRGYIWVEEAFYDREGPVEAMQDYVDLIQEGYKFGAPASSNEDLYGLYRPLKKSTK